MSGVAEAARKARRHYAARAIIRSEPHSFGHYAMVVLAVMATWADPTDPEPVCFKEQESIARRAKLSVSTVGRALRELEAAGAIKRLGIVGGGRDPRTGQVKRGTIRWGLILIWGDDLSVPQTDKDRSVPQTDKSRTVPQTDKGSVPQTDKGSVPQTDNPSQSQSDERASDDDDSVAGDRPGAGAPTGAAPLMRKPDLANEAAEVLGWPLEACREWVAGILAKHRPKNPTGYIRAAIADQLERANAGASAPTGRTRQATPVKPAVARCIECGKKRALHLLVWQVDPAEEPPVGAGYGVCGECWPSLGEGVDEMAMKSAWLTQAAESPPCERCGRPFARQGGHETVALCPYCWRIGDPYERRPAGVTYCVECGVPTGDGADVCEPCWQKAPGAPLGEAADARSGGSEGAGIGAPKACDRGAFCLDPSCPEHPKVSR
ncbi:hypothetical protein ABT369_05395 [Dactylosporangium sp. NPDC000244]|uniref:hypothetical protein n=1 Tax=Dactylosporangium sp. NPDC000244 TaxID=3154365 RepID=UPI0033205828